jgi:cytochrome P450
LCRTAKRSPLAKLCSGSYRYQEHMDDLEDLDVASECASHLLAGIEKTSHTLMFFIWRLSLPQNANFQQKLIEECQSIPDKRVSMNAVSLWAIDQLPYLNAVIKEILRLFEPLPASEPRSSPQDTVIDGYQIPRGTVCSMAPYSLHRNEDTYPELLRWKPERWLIEDREKLAEKRKWLRPFSYGARMCIGMQ